MAFVNVVFNGLAAGFLGDFAQVRIRVKDGQLQFRPTNRSSEINLPKGERLREIFRTGQRVWFSVKEDFLEADRIALVEDETYGWFTLIYGESDYRTVPSAKLTLATANSVKRAKKAVKPFDESAKHVSVPQ